MDDKRIVFSLNIGLAGRGQEEPDVLEMLGLTYQEWVDLPEDEKSEHLKEWMWNYIEASHYEEEK